MNSTLQIDVLDDVIGDDLAPVYPTPSAAAAGFHQSGMTSGGMKFSRTPVYIILTELNEQTRKKCVNRCVANLGGSDIIHTILYLPVMESTYTANKEDGVRCNPIQDFGQLQESKSQKIFEFWITYDQFVRMYEYLEAHKGDHYDDCMFSCGWLNFFCTTDIMEACCTTHGTQTCSRLVMGAIRAAGIAIDCRAPINFIYPSDVETCIYVNPDVFTRVDWLQMVDSVNDWFDKTKVAQRGVHVVGNVDILGARPAAYVAMAAGPASSSGSGGASTSAAREILDRMDGAGYVYPKRYAGLPQVPTDDYDYEDDSEAGSEMPYL